MVPRVHDHKRIFQSVLFPKLFGSIRIRLHLVLMSPGRQHVDLFTIDSLGCNPITHKTVEGDNRRRLPQTFLQLVPQKTLHRTPLPQPTRRHRLIRVQIHHPRDQSRPHLSRISCSHHGEQGRRGQGNDHIGFGLSPQGDFGRNQPGGKINRSSPFRPLPHRGVPYSADMHPVPILLRGK